MAELEVVVEEREEVDNTLFVALLPSLNTLFGSPGNLPSRLPIFFTFSSSSSSSFYSTSSI